MTWVYQTLGSIVYEDETLIGGLKSAFANIQYRHFSEIKAEEHPQIILVQSADFSHGYLLYKKINNQSIQKLSVVTGRILSNEALPQDVPQGVVLLPQCDDQVFVHWVATLLYDFAAPTCCEWFLNPLSNFYRRQKPLDRFWGELHTLKPNEITSENFADRIGCSKRYLEKLCFGLWGISPGMLFRTWRLFETSAKLMYREKFAETRNRRGYSPLAMIESDYRRSLKKLIGITYSELRLYSQQEHWIAVWMRKWREREREREGESGRECKLHILKPDPCCNSNSSYFYL